MHIVYILFAAIHCCSLFFTLILIGRDREYPVCSTGWRLAAWSLVVYCQTMLVINAILAFNSVKG